MEMWLKGTMGTMAVVAGLATCVQTTPHIETKAPIEIVDPQPVENNLECLTELVDKETEKEQGYNFTVQKQIKSTPVKRQGRSSACWSFSGLSLLESELMRMGKDEIDLSEMFIVRNSYTSKAKKFVRMHGEINFGAGGLFQDVMDAIKEHGIVPEKVYNGMNIGEKKHVHSEMIALLGGYVDTVIKNKNRKLSPAWLKGFEGVLDAYLGELPNFFFI